MTRTNSATAVEIAKRVGDLIQLLNETVDGVKAEIQKLDVGDARFRAEHLNKSMQFDVAIESLRWCDIHKTY